MQRYLLGGQRFGKTVPPSTYLTGATSVATPSDSTKAKSLMAFLVKSIGPG